MNAFIHENFLLRSDLARFLYHEHAAAAPILDYHCHLDPRDLAADRQFENVAQLWVTNDPYKHRAMRIAGVPERLITGAASEREKFDAWAAIVPRLLGNPLHAWTALELKRTFGIDEPLDATSAGRTWDQCNTQLAAHSHSARGLLVQRGVTLVCTSDRLLDDLAPHAAASAGPGPRVLPSLRADDAVAVEDPGFPRWLTQLGFATGGPIADLAGFEAALERRLDVFAAAGCRLADHGLDEFSYESVDAGDAAGHFERVRAGESLPAGEAHRLRSHLLRFLGAAYARRGWILQLHLGAQRRTSTRLRLAAGTAGGFAGIGARANVPALCRWFDDLETAGALPRIILYPLDPADFVPLAVLTGSFVGDGVPGQVQLGPAWWYNDHAHGIRAHLDAIAHHGLLSVFIGMTTDSRSLLSMVRHEYFRRVLCDWLAGQVARGTMPSDHATLGELVRALASGNARAALGV